MHFRSILFSAFAVLLLCAPGQASAFDSGPSTPSSSTGQDPLVAARAAIDNKDWPKAITLLKEQTAKDPHNADAFNLLGFSQRNAGDMPSALTSYNRALALNPNHKGAHEYLGETYLKLNDLPKAEAEQAKLQALCPQGCEELTDINEAIADYKKARTNK